MGGTVTQEWRKMAMIVDDEPQISGDYQKAFVGSTNKDAANKISAKAKLHELCSKRHWKCPVYECCNAEGPGHRKLFTFKIVVEIKEETMTIECFGNPRTTKKAAAEDAAEGALWCLNKWIYQPNKQ